jgi:hypothetical protein
MQVKDVQYLLAFREHMNTTNMQIQSLQRELNNKKKKDQSLETIQVLTKDVMKLREQCNQLNEERESKSLFLRAL